MRRQHRTTFSTPNFFVLCFLFLVFLLSPASPVSAQALSVVSAGPTGEIASQEQANEIRVVFSEPMVSPV